jgi:hypothetical protein
VPRQKITKLDPRAPVQQLLGTFVCHKRFGLRVLARCFIRGPFSQLSFYVDALSTSLTDDSPQNMRLATPPSPLLVSALYLTCIRQ